MRHPFAGIESAQKPAQPEIQTTRRNLFGLAAGIVAAPRGRPTTRAIGDVGGRPTGRDTRARGEQGQRRGWKK